MGDLYRFANSQVFGLTLCVPVKNRGEFYAALCYDVKITQKAIPFVGDSNVSFELYKTPMILH